MQWCTKLKPERRWEVNKLFLIFFLSWFQPYHLHPFLPLPLRLSLCLFLSQNKADLCLWSSSSSSPPSVWPSLINIHSSLQQKGGLNLIFTLCLDGSSSQLCGSQHKTILGCHLAQILFTSTHLWNCKDLHGVFHSDWLNLKLTSSTTAWTNSQPSCLINLCMTAGRVGIYQWPPANC